MFPINYQRIPNLGSKSLESNYWILLTKSNIPFLKKRNTCFLKTSIRKLRCNCERGNTLCRSISWTKSLSDFTSHDCRHSPHRWIGWIQCSLPAPPLFKTIFPINLQASDVSLRFKMMEPCWNVLLAPRNAIKKRFKTAHKANT